MANAYSSISLTTPIADIKAALIAKYGGGNVTVHYETTAYLIFGCTDIADKVIKIYWASSQLRIYYGDAWTSGSTITNEVQFAGHNLGTTSEIHLVLGTNLFYLALLSSSINSMVAIIAKMSNNDYICIGLIGTSTAAYNANSKGRNTTDATDLKFVTLNSKFTSSTGTLYKQNVIIVKSDGSAEVNGDGGLATIADLFNISHSLTVATLLKGTNYLMSPCNLYMADCLTYLPTCLFAEF